MTLLLNCQSLTKFFGSRLLFENLNFSIFTQQRVGLIGPNGAGKSTLLKILAGAETPTSGNVSAKRGLKIGYVPQSCDFQEKLPEEILLEALKHDERPDYEKELAVQTLLSKLGFKDDSLTANRLSGGWKKRLSIAQAVILSPDLLLLDEPTNHLDLEGIFWLEKFLAKEAPSFILVSHDRYFLQNMVDRVVEINPVYPQGLFSIEGSYLHFLEKKEEFLLGQVEQERSMASKARRELEWVSRSPKARTSKSKSRVGQAHELFDELSEIKGRNRQKTSDIDFAATERQTQKLLTAKNLSKKIGNRVLFNHLDFVLSPGTRLGLMGPNGSGKTTLLKILTGDLTPDQGTIKQVDGLKIVYFDQHRLQLPGHLTLAQALSPDGDFVTFRGQKIHVNGWCQRFLFSTDMLMMPLDKLSGGERARISIAHLMLQPADILLLDEPTNDLDIPTLETLEESLLDFPGAVVLITHDRCMLDRICNSLLALGNPDLNEFFSDYTQWQASLKPAAPLKKEEKKNEPKAAKPKLSYAEKKEYDQIESTLLKLEEEVKNLNHTLETTPQNPEELQLICTQIGLAETRIEQLYLRWDELEKKQQGT